MLKIWILLWLSFCFLSKADTLRLRRLQSEGAKTEVCHIPPSDPELFKTISVKQTEVSTYLLENQGDILGSCESQCDVVCNEDDLCTSNVEINSAEICTCLSEPLPIEVPTGEKCCSPHGTIIAQESCCPIGVDQCCGLDVVECYGVVNPFAIEFQLAVFGNQLKPGEKPGLASFQIDSKVAEAEIGTTHLATNINSHSFEFSIIDIILTAEEMLSQSKSPTVPQEWTELMSTLEELDDPEIKAEQNALVTDWETPIDPKEFQEIQERNVLTKIILADAPILYSSTQPSRMEFVALIECFTEKNAVFSCNLMVLGDPTDFMAAPMEHTGRNLISEADCQSTYDALKAAAEKTFCKEVETFKSDPTCEKAIVTACRTDMQTAKAIYEAALIAAELARAAAMALEIALKARKYTLAVLACSRLIIPWAAIACLVAALALIEYQCYARKQLIEEIKRAAIMLALRNYETAIALAVDVLRAAASACWDCIPPPPNDDDDDDVVFDPDDDTPIDDDNDDVSSTDDDDEGAPIDDDDDNLIDDDATPTGDDDDATPIDDDDEATPIDDDDEATPIDDDDEATPNDDDDEATPIDDDDDATPIDDDDDATPIDDDDGTTPSDDDVDITPIDDDDDITPIDDDDDDITPIDDDDDITPIKDDDDDDITPIKDDDGVTPIDDDDTSTPAPTPSPPPTPGVVGEPHFVTWSGCHFSYQGACDLILIHNPIFAGGMGLDLHVRTEHMSDKLTSFVSNAALRIGSDILEVVADGTYIINGVTDAALPGLIGGNIVTRTEKESCRGLEEHQKCWKSTSYDVDLGHDHHFNLKVAAGMVHVFVKGFDKFEGSVGVMGTYPSSMHQGRFARDGVTFLDDHDRFAEEWQVLGSEPKLFLGPRFPQHPDRCIPELKAERKLLESEENMLRIMAEEACSHVRGQKWDFCVYDIIATGKIDLALTIYDDEM